MEPVQKLRIQLFSGWDLAVKALELAVQLDQATAYDTCYLAVAEMCHAIYWTADERFYNSIQDKVSYVIKSPT